jgi:hypothetical protein
MEKQNKYLNGKIYKITDTAYNECYFGSTINKLCKRMSEHRSNYKRYLNGKTHNISSYTLFEKYGNESLKIELVEMFPCASRSELLQREGFYIKNYECVNKHIAGRTKKEHSAEYHQANKDKILERHRLYHQANKDKINERHRQYRLLKKQKEAL